MASQPPFPVYHVPAAAPLPQAGKGLWLWWISITFVAFFIAFISGIIAFAILFSAGMSGNQNEIWPFAVSIVIVVAGAALIGWLQYRTLLRYIPLTRWWIIATVGGLGVGLVITFVRIDTIEFVSGYTFIWRAAVFYGLPGFVLGLAQWVIFQHYVRFAWVWIMAHGGAAFVVGALSGIVTDDVWHGIVSSIFFTATTSGALVWLLRRRRLESPQ